MTPTNIGDAIRHVRSMAFILAFMIASVSLLVLLVAVPSLVPSLDNDEMIFGMFLSTSKEAPIAATLLNEPDSMAIQTPI